MTPLIELIPVLVFFIAYRWTDIYVATTIMMAISIVQLLVSLLRQEKLPTARWINFATLMILGMVALIFRNAHFIKWKPTIAYCMAAIALRFTSCHNRATLPEEVLGLILSARQKVWLSLNNTWAAFFYMLGVLNLLVAYTTSTNTWVYFKLFGVISLFILFFIVQIAYLIYFNKAKFRHEFNPQKPSNLD